MPRFHLRNSWPDPTSGTRIAWPVRPFRPSPAVFRYLMPNCQVAAGRVARSLKSWPIAPDWASVRCYCQRFAACARKTGGPCCWLRRMACMRRPGRPAASIWRAWRWSRQHGRAMCCGRPSTPCRAAPSGRCCAGHGPSTPARRDVSRSPSPAAIRWPSCFGPRAREASRRRPACGFYSRPARTAGSLSICSSDAGRRVPGRFISICRDR